MLVKVVIRTHVSDHRDQEQAHGHADGKTKCVEKGKVLVLIQIPDGYFQVIAEHIIGEFVGRKCTGFCIPFSFGQGI